MTCPTAAAPDETCTPYVFTTLRYEDELRRLQSNTAAADGFKSPVYLVHAHLHRLRQAADAVFTGQGSSILQRAGLVGPSDLEKAITRATSRSEPHPREEQRPSASRIRLQCDVQGRLSFSFGPLSTSSSKSLFPQKLEQSAPSYSDWKVVLDVSAIRKSSATQHKTYDRRVYDRARHEAGIESLRDTREVLLFDEAGHIMDASISTPYFWRNDVWVTPSTETGGQQGTTRSWALEHGICVQGWIHTSSLQIGEVIWLSNAVRGFFPAIYSSR